jgi:hypothetical protein
MEQEYDGEMEVLIALGPPTDRSDEIAAEIPRDPFPQARGLTLKARQIAVALARKVRAAGTYPPMV